ncbi:MAG: alpha/beta hydrolase [Dongiaceae bacterium]
MRFLYSLARFRFLLRLLGMALAAYVFVGAYLTIFQRDFIYLPDTTPPSLAGLNVAGMEEIIVPVTEPDGTGLLLKSWYHPPRAPDNPVVMYFQGNGGNIGWRNEKIRFFVNAGYGVFMVGYRGYGANPGHPTEAGLRRDAAHARLILDNLLRRGQRQSMRRPRVVCYGESLGAGLCIQIAASVPDFALLLLEAPFKSLADVAAHRYQLYPLNILSWLLKDKFDSIHKIAAVRTPILFLHGQKDAITPVEHSYALMAAANEPKEGWFPEDGGHNDLSKFGSHERAREFIDKYLPPKVKP